METKKLRVFEAFSGVGSQAMALRDLGINYEVVAISEIDKFAIQSYEAIHGPVNNLGDISKLAVEDIPDHDLFTYSFPCQDISISGDQGGLDEGSETRSSLLWQCRKVISGKKPKYALLENVKNLVGKKHRHNFKKWLNWLESQGYTNYWKVLNAIDYGIPQNRERVFVVSILGEHKPFKFPEPTNLVARLKDLLEPKVDEKFYLNNEKTKELLANLPDLNLTNIKLAQIGNLEKVLGNYEGKFNDPQIGRVFNPEGLSPALDTMQGGNRQPKIIQKIGNVNPSGKGIGGVVVHENGVLPTITAGHGEGPKVLVKNATNKGYSEAVDGDGIDLAFPNSKTRRGSVQPQRSHTLTTSDNLGVLEAPLIAASRGRNPEKPSNRTVGSHVEQRLEINSKGVSNTLTTVQKDNYVIEPSGLYTSDSPKFHRGPLFGLSRTLKASNHDTGVTDGYCIRKLTPLECWRLMGFTDIDFYKAQEVCSNSQLYKQAGNSIVKYVLMAIFNQLFKKQEPTSAGTEVSH